ncbi:S-methyl-5-thioribose-1-phosphate isomerase [Sphingomonas sp. TREG-RG-20F-R18-01]|uniref:S-methyl-5-thioribose-1-phosphate isomerase n=1 Tax=Sphingomonas sp. TREG-RG-20F-R18-01 TaxID=2914982 RepID=UPI001F55D889|nr:S-methyl-5-thioribose-1-phosphate isomerase [Sphingomonas sp. TREG-RG-20F-R18-01]
MILDGKKTRSIWLNADGWSVGIFDQRRLPWAVERLALTTVDECAHAIADMATRGAPLIGAVAAYGMALALRVEADDAALERAYRQLLATRPTAVNLKWALDRVRSVVARLPAAERAVAAYADAAALCDEDVAINAAIGRAGLEILQDLATRHPGRPINILTHCNAGWLATVDWGTATAPIYMAHDLGIPVHVWVDETRPRNQGALTALELAGHAIPHTYVVDNAGGLLMQRGQVDLVIVGTDRVTRNGDVCNKIGTYLKALAARDNGIPFVVALPSSTYDPMTADGAAVPVEERAPAEVRSLEGPDDSGTLRRITVTTAPAANPAFDITPARLITEYITDRGRIVGPTALADAFRA